MIQLHNFSKPFTYVYDGKNLDFYIDSEKDIWLDLNQFQEISGREVDWDYIRADHFIERESQTLISEDEIDNLENLWGNSQFFDFVKVHIKNLFNLVYWLLAMDNVRDESDYLKISDENKKLIGRLIGLTVKDIWG